MDDHAEITIPIKEDPSAILKLEDSIKLKGKEVALDVTGNYIQCIFYHGQSMSNYVFWLQLPSHPMSSPHLP